MPKGRKTFIKDPITNKANTNKTIWTEEKCTKTVLEMLDKIRSKEGKSIFTIQKLCENFGFGRWVWNEHFKTYRNDHIITHTIKRIEDDFEDRLVTFALANKINTTMSIFVLKNKYGYKDKQDLSHSTDPDNPFKVETNISVLFGKVDDKE